MYMQNSVEIKMISREDLNIRDVQEGSDQNSLIVEKFTNPTVGLAEDLPPTRRQIFRFFGKISEIFRV